MRLYRRTERLRGETGRRLASRAWRWRGGVGEWGFSPARAPARRDRGCAKAHRRTEAARSIASGAISTNLADIQRRDGFGFTRHDPVQFIDCRLCGEPTMDQRWRIGLEACWCVLLMIARVGGTVWHELVRRSHDDTIPLTASLRRQIGALACLVIAVAVAACSAPIKVEHVDLRTAYEDRNRTALSSDRLSDTTRTVLRRAALLDTFDDQPDAAIAALRAQAIATGMLWPDLYALSEMSYYEGGRTNSKPLLLASALYAYAVLFPTGDADTPSPYSAQFQRATDFYNLALTQVLSSDSAKDAATLQGGQYPLPFGSVDVILNQSTLTFAGRTMASFVPTMNMTVQGFKNDYRSDGLGAPLAAALAPAPQPDSGLMLPPNLRVPTSALLQMDNPRRELMGTALTARLSVYTIYDTAEIPIGGRTVPLEYDQTAVRALFAVEGKGWTRELSGLLTNVLNNPNDPNAKDHLFALEPHRRGRIPVALVHGTASSPFRWADMVNDLLEDREIRDHYEFWFFTYNTGNPIPISANVLRHSLEDAVRSLGGVQGDAALRRMVVIGHSQGGLLTKMVAINSGSKIWDAISNKPVDELGSETRDQGIAEGVAVRPPTAVRGDGDLHLHAAWRQLSGEPDGGRSVPAAGDAAGDHCKRHRRYCHQRW